MSQTVTLYTRNIVEDGALAATGSAQSGYPESRLYDRSISFYWQVSGAQATDFTVDQGASGNEAVDFLAVARHNFSGEDMQWQWSTDNFAADINDAVTDWTQGDNEQIIKTLGSALTKRYWRVTLTSMTDPRAAEVYMSYGYTFDIMANPAPSGWEQPNVGWQRTTGGGERSVKFGPLRRRRKYALFLSAAELTTFEAALDDLDAMSQPFWVCDHAGDYFPCRFAETPQENYSHKTYTGIELSLVEMV